jgi:trehalose 6-phosphate phosphatase
VPIAASFQLAWEGAAAAWEGIAAILDAVPRESPTGEAAWATLLASFRAEPRRAAVLTDVDGTLAPIVERAEDAAVPAAAREALATLTERFGLVGCISGRQALEARRLVGLDGIAYAGNHGLELLLPGDEAPRPDPSIAGREDDAAAFLAGLDASALEAVELRQEDKGPIQALHWRGAANEAAAEGHAHEISVEAGHAGLDVRWGRKVVELRPAGGGGKDGAVASLLASDGFERATYAGDDRTDLDAFRRLRQLDESGQLTAAVCVGVVSAEAPPQLAEESDLTVDGPDGWLRILEWLAE